MNLDKIVAKQIPQARVAYSPRDTMLYALGVNACDDPLNADQLSFVYESNLQALPSMACVLAHPGMWITDPELGINFVKLVHAEQHFDLNTPLPPEGEVVGRYKITGVTDKGTEKGAMLYFEKELYTTSDAFIGTVISTYYLRGDGGCGNWGEPGRDLQKVPEQPPAGALDVHTLPVSALIYRLSGDYNPLHADPEIARKAGFDKPILHGLCTYGIACQALVRATCGNDATRLRAMGARFTKPVYPGETIRTEYWQGSDGAMQFRCTSVERGEVVLDRGTARVCLD